MNRVPGNWLEGNRGEKIGAFEAGGLVERGVCKRVGGERRGGVGGDSCAGDGPEWGGGGGSIIQRLGFVEMFGWYVAERVAQAFVERVRQTDGDVIPPAGNLAGVSGETQAQLPDSVSHWKRKIEALSLSDCVQERKEKKQRRLKLKRVEVESS